jgi:hypothetical protein
MVLPETRAWALDLAIRAACSMNRFAGNGYLKCDGPGNLSPQPRLNVFPVIPKPEALFRADIEPGTFSDKAIRNAIRSIKNRQEDYRTTIHIGGIDLDTCGWIIA